MRPSTADIQSLLTTPVQCSSLHPRYLQCGPEPFIPIGCNLCFPRFFCSPEDGLETMRHYLDTLADNGGNYTRFFLGHPFFDIEAKGMGCFDTDKAQLIRLLLDHAHNRGIRIKLTLEQFRHITPQAQAEGFPGAANFSRPIYYPANGGAFTDMDDYLTSDAGRQHYLRKLDWLTKRLGNHPAIFGWELWNEMNSLGDAQWLTWTDFMLPELQRRFPDQLVMQNLGSFDRDAKRPIYERVMSLPDNDIAQVHRYLDLAAPWNICHGPLDVMMASAITELRRIAPNKPVMLSEGGAVESRHARPWELYEKDREGIVLHDTLFAPFFAGSAGSGQPWHWHEYVDRHQLWWHFQRFARAIEGIDPIREDFRPSRYDTHNLRLYHLHGDQTSLIWCRDSASNWKTELAEGLAPVPVKGETIELSRLGLSAPLPQATLRSYDPWSDTWTQPTPISPSGTISLPTITRSLVLRISAKAEGSAKSDLT
jgi:hypothetical protein